jgi:hypothetical protein
MSLTLVVFENRSDKSASMSDTTRPRTSDNTARPSSMPRRRRSRSTSPLESHSCSESWAWPAAARPTTSSMISLPTYRVATGRKARARRQRRSAVAIPGLVFQMSLRNGGRFFRAPNRSRRERTAGGGPLAA